MPKNRKNPVKQITRILERDVQKGVIEHATKKGIRHIRMYFGPGMRVGWPDVLFLFPGGIPLFIEFKAPGKVPTPKQWSKIDICRALNYRVEVCDNVEDGYAMIDKHLAAVQAFYETAKKRGKKK